MCVILVNRLEIRAWQDCCSLLLCWISQISLFILISWLSSVYYCLFHLCLSLEEAVVDVVYFLNAFHAAGECRRQVKKLSKCAKNVKIVEFHYRIWNHNEKCIKISTNMPGIGSLIREIYINISEIGESKQRFCSVKPMPVFEVLKWLDVYTRLYRCIWLLIESDHVSWVLKGLVNRCKMIWLSLVTDAKVRLS